MNWLIFLFDLIFWFIFCPTQTKFKLNRITSKLNILTFCFSIIFIAVNLSFLSTWLMH